MGLRCPEIGNHWVLVMIRDFSENPWDFVFSMWCEHNAYVLHNAPKAVWKYDVVELWSLELQTINYYDSYPWKPKNMCIMPLKQTHSVRHPQIFFPLTVAKI